MSGAFLLRRSAQRGGAVLERLQVVGRHLAGANGWTTPVCQGRKRDSDGGSDGGSAASSRRSLVTAGAAAMAATSAGALYGATRSAESSAAQCESAPKTALKPQEFVPFRLQQVQELSHNTKIFRFELEPDQRLGLSVASCLITRAAVGPSGEDGRPKPILRPYTPITPPDATGHFDLLVKMYPGGNLSRHIFSLKPGDMLEMKGPIHKLAYHPNMKRYIGMVAGGTGIAPMLQIIDAILSNPNDFTQVSLVFANASPDDILLKDQLLQLQAAHPNFKVFFTVDRTDPSWKGGVGFITTDMLKKALPPPSTDSYVLVCGPPGMMAHVSGDKAPDKSQGEVEGLLKQLGYTKDHVYKF